MRPSTTIGELTEPLRALVKGFLERYPRAKAQDVYCLLHAGACVGGEELDQAVVVAKLQAAAATASAAGPLLEDSSVDGKVVRVNIGTYVAQGGQLELLAKAVIETARAHQPRRDLLFTLWSGFVHMNRRHEFRLDRDDLDHFEMRVATASYPAMEPSREFQAAYNPQQATVLRELVPSVMPSQEST